MESKQVNRRAFLFGSAAAVGGLACLAGARSLEGLTRAAAPAAGPVMVTVIDFSDDGKRIGSVQVARVVKTDAEWRQQLKPFVYQVTRRAATETPFSGAYDPLFKPGLYRCICCGNALYSSATKYDSHTGWPSFWQPIAKENVRERADNSLGMERTEVLCTKCDAHLGHVFNDGPDPTGLRYCMNSVALNFIPKP